MIWWETSDKSRANVLNRSPHPVGPPSASTPPVTTSSPPASSARDNPTAGARSGVQIKCYNCRLDGHMARNCPNRSPHPVGPSSASTPPVNTSSRPASSARDNPTAGARSGVRIKCCNCRLHDHMARNCPYPKKSRREEEARGPPLTQGLPRPGPPQKTMAALVGDENGAKTQVEHLGKDCRTWKRSSIGRTHCHRTQCLPSCDKKIAQ